MYNKIVLMGNLTRDVEVRFTNGGLTIANTAIATSRKFKGQDGQQKEEVTFVDLTFFGRTAEIAKQYLHKGSKLLVEGRLNFDQWVDQHGTKRSKHTVAVQVLQLMDSRNSTPASTVQSTPQKQSTPMPSIPTDDGFVTDEEFPF